MSRIRQSMQETREERDTRVARDFPHVEHHLPIAWPGRDLSWLGLMSSFLGSRNPLAQPADPRKHTVWVLDNTAYRPVNAPNRDRQPWQAEVVACIFVKHGRKDIGKFVASVADMIGLDGELGKTDDRVIRRRMADRLQPFVDAIAPSRFVTLEIPVPSGSVHVRKLRPTEKNGVSTQTLLTGGKRIPDGTVIHPWVRDWGSSMPMNTVFAGPEGWAIISDVDDTIKYTQTSDPVGILRTTFAEEPEPIRGMPELYRHIDRRLAPAWFYLSASPYNLYPFLRKFLHSYYTPGTLILRDKSWMDLSGLLKSFTQGTQTYKVNRMKKIHSWFPKRKMLCIGDSTQSDPEAYAELYHLYGPWIRAIFIRRVTDIANMEDKNTNERFKEAFKGVPRRVWKVFDRPEEIYGLIDQLDREEDSERHYYHSRKRRSGLGSRESRRRSWF
ncbi:hypothetical protein FQN54_009435 [Arachnomyces sp. PD_36]|nr:hypothetical protein FQN54_009435 [Arachnomyces sp. PD_36]